jgi:hypothetical protein
MQRVKHRINCSINVLAHRAAASNVMECYGGEEAGIAAASARVGIERARRFRRSGAYRAKMAQAFRHALYHI